MENLYVEEINRRSWWLFAGNNALAFIELLEDGLYHIHMDDTNFYFRGTYKEMEKCALNAFMYS